MENYTQTESHCLINHCISVLIISLLTELHPGAGVRAEHGCPAAAGNCKESDADHQRPARPAPQFFVPDCSGEMGGGQLVSLNLPPVFLECRRAAGTRVESPFLTCRNRAPSSLSRPVTDLALPPPGMGLQWPHNTHNRSI